MKLLVYISSMSHNPEIRKKLAERIKKEKEQKFRPAYLPDEGFDKKEVIEDPKSKEERKKRRSNWRKRLGISSNDFEYEDHRPVSNEPPIICKECGEKAVDNNQKFCEMCGTKL